ncbi:hypothetical protein SPSYN_02000 [Sporotomaculum syntrophicum]|uniref:DUF881 domain-containing protein n=1 Tax=Sporotomaculum syntrophicum TaxID=182264 RepID=A0A9D2WPN4_9FIRM|nr:DUF881 domain-containing protein [Sporotomaculum syntrophicum]KAF1084830.1 hypothetical protein SPSYN_02000 [Sporotomaculum syntrophicum]
MPQKTSMYISIMLVAAVLGLMLSLQFRAVNRASSGISIDRAQEVTAELKRINQDKEDLSKEINDLTSKLNQVKQGQAEAVAALQSELNKVRMNAGLITVSGSGIELVLDKPDNTEDTQIPPELMVIQDEYLLSALNELWGAGAEAISINGQRIIATTEIRQAGSFININLNRVVPPYQILAIGNPQELMNTLEMTGGLQEYWRDLGIKVTIEKHEDLTLPAYVKK